MALHIGEEAPNFTAETTEGTINFHEWVGDGWAILFSHPKDFTPVCTTELGYMAGLKPEFERRNCKIMGLSIDPVSDHTAWVKDIEETQGHSVTYPLIGDTDLAVAKLYDMIHPNASGTAKGRTAADNATVRSVFIVGPDKKIKLMITYPMSTGAELRRGPPGVGFLSIDSATQSRHPGELETGGGRDYCSCGFGRRSQGKIPRRLENAKAVSADRTAAAIRLVVREVRQGGR